MSKRYEAIQIVEQRY